MVKTIAKGNEQQKIRKQKSLPKRKKKRKKKKEVRFVNEDTKKRKITIGSDTVEQTRVKRMRNFLSVCLMDFSRRVSSVVRLIENMKCAGLKFQHENCADRDHGDLPWFACNKFVL